MRRSTRAAILLGVTAGGAWGGACGVAALDETGKRCGGVYGACDAPWSCVNSACALDASAEGDAGDAGAEGDANLGAVAVSDLVAAWTTTNTIRWTWKSSGKPDDLFEYRLEITSNAPDAGGTGTWTRAQNPELGTFLIFRSTAADPVVATMTDRHDPDTIYRARLVAVDTRQQTYTSNEAVARTQAVAANAIEVYHDDPPAGACPDPQTITFPTDPANAAGGSRYLEYVEDCAEMEGGAPADGGFCTTNIHLGCLAVPLGAIQPNAFDTSAFVEFKLRLMSPYPSGWSLTILGYPGAGATTFADFEPWTMRNDDAYRTIQIPLRAFTVAGAPIAYDAGFAPTMNLFMVGGSFWSGSIVRIDEVYVRY